ncbi:MAG TPA: alpha/beta fold hydrolase [Mycobacteriales bacterium]|nr:alpha/beta fold hydrolase [Mycobacteriales bacterium]
MRDVHPLPGADHVVDGVRVHVVRHGTGSGLPVVLLHGLPTSSYLWRDVQRDLEHTHRTYAPDVIGLGRSERPADGRYDLASQAELMLALLDELSLERVALVGHDLGGALAVHLTALAPARVAALVLVDAALHADTWPVAAVSGLVARGLGELQTTLLRAVPGAGRSYLARQLGRGLAGGPMDDTVLGHYARPLLTADGARGLLSFVRAFDPPAAEAALRLVAAEPPPTLVLWGDEDVWHGPAYGRRLAADIPGAVLVPVPDAGHLLPEERPERVSEELAGFLAEAVARTG